MIIVPQNTLTAIPEHPAHEQDSEEIVVPLKGNPKRDWFIPHAYFCLPLTIGNQYGFAIKSMVKFTAVWTGGNSASDVIVSILEPSEPTKKQFVSSHFGMGTITIQNRFTFRTPPGVNLMTINPPNYWIDGIQHMTGVIETDNLRRDFTFNLKLTRKDHVVEINKGDFIGCVLPIPRYFPDSFEFKPAKDLFTKEQIEEEQKAMHDFGVERSTADKQKFAANGRRYFTGEDIYGNKFPDHQRSMK